MNIGYNLYNKTWNIFKIPLFQLRNFSNVLNGVKLGGKGYNK